jgi:hypothetical protein
MRKIYYRFPQRVDLSFAMGMPFNETFKYIAGLDNEESTKTTGKELVKVKTKIQIAVDRATFGDITPEMQNEWFDSIDNEQNFFFVIHLHI